MFSLFVYLSETAALSSCLSKAGSAWHMCDNIDQWYHMHVIRSIYISYIHCQHWYWPAFTMVTFVKKKKT